MATEIATKIKSAGYYQLKIAPSKFVAEKLAPSELWQIIERCQVNYRGREFPRLDRTASRAPDRSDSISQAVQRYHHLETWRFFRSGQFTDLRAMQTDWLAEMAGGEPPNYLGVRGKYVYIEHVLMAFGEAFEFATRLSSTKAGDDQMSVELLVGGLLGRRLTVADEWNHLDRLGGSDPAVLADFRKRYLLSRLELMASARELTIRATQDFCEAIFGKPVPSDLLRDWSKELQG